MIIGRLKLIIFGSNEKPGNAVAKFGNVAGFGNFHFPHFLPGSFPNLATFIVVNNWHTFYHCLLLLSTVFAVGCRLLLLFLASLLVMYLPLYTSIVYIQYLYMLKILIKKY